MLYRGVAWNYNCTRKVTECLPYIWEYWGETLIWEYAVKSDDCLSIVKESKGGILKLVFDG